VITLRIACFKHSIEIVPIVQRKAKAWIREKHRHLSPPVGDLYRTSLEVDGELVAVAMAGRPCRMLDDGRTVEITRVASVAEVTVNASSRLYSSLVAAGRSLGWKRFVTYTLIHEPGTSLRAANFEDDGITDGGEWSRPSRNRKPVEQSGAKRRWIFPGRNSGLWNQLGKGKRNCDYFGE
jgi:hypothetical protein